MNRQRKNGLRKSSSMARRLNFLFAIVVFLFIVLLLRLAQMQLLEKSFYTDKLNSTKTYTVKASSPRGKIYDAKGVLLADNTIKEVVSFTRYPSVTAQEMKALVKTLSNYVTYTETHVTDREKRDYYLADPETYQKVVDRLPDKEKYDQFGNSLKESTIYQHAIDAVTDDEIKFSDDELKQIYIFSQMNATTAFNTTSLNTAELSAEQIAKISASKELEGISVQSDWERTPVKTSLSELIGQVSSEESGLPKEDAEAYLAKGYSLNDRVGTSFLEKYYEEQLQGLPELTTVTVDKNGKVVKEAQDQEGQSGNNLKLTIDLEFQKGVEGILQKYYQSELSAGNLDLSEGVYAVAMDPQTGAILASAGLDHEKETDKLTLAPIGTVTNVFTPGSVVKGATIASGYENGVITGNQVLNDQPIQLAGSAPINSWFTRGSQPITATQALEYSSNTYMVQIAMKLMGQDYVPNMYLSTDRMDDAMSALRKTYGEFGLGVNTGIDLPDESTGYISKDYDAAAVLTESFGQYDNYTTMQLAQYVSTVANGGHRIAPHFVEGIYGTTETGELGELKQAIEPKVLNDVAISQEDLAIIQQGFYDVVHGQSGFATGTAIGNGAQVPIAAKTGTAESYVKNKAGESVYTTNLNVIAYAPTQNPKIAVAVMLPHVTDFDSKSSQYMARDIINLYHQMYPMND